MTLCKEYVAASYNAFRAVRQLKEEPPTCIEPGEGALDRLLRQAHGKRPFLRSRQPRGAHRLETVFLQRAMPAFEMAEQRFKNIVRRRALLRQRCGRVKRLLGRMAER